MGLVHDDPKYQPGEPPKSDSLPDGTIISSDTRRENRIPPGQSRTRKWPVLQAGSVPHVNRDEWTLTVCGEVDHPFTLDWNQFRELPRSKVFADMHCVTKWSRLGNIWEGVSTREIAKLAGIKPTANFVLPEGYDRGWTTNLPLKDFLEEDCLLVDTHDGQPLDDDHGAPVRLMIPRLYAWKSAKWLKTLEFSIDDRLGFWEQGGYHAYGDPWREQRFAGDDVPPGFYD